ncbi:hypothetical protein F5Y19DRAFT_469069 [Xylariaceae sp. FL1651]|nr:hypothetical protein F5Y19DRAFT_469069 [Xylariaceae sp. FL1651]
MVGVLGRNEEKPICRRCEKGGFECLGYARPTQWRNTSTITFSVHVKEQRHGSDSITGNDAVLRDRGQNNQGPRDRGHICHPTGFDTAAKGKLGSLPLDSSVALAQLFFGKMNRVPQVELQGRLQYGKCLQGLVHEISNRKPVAGGQTRDLLIPVLAMLMYASTSGDRNAAIFHMMALNRILTVSGPKAFQTQPYRNALEAARATLSAPYALELSEKPLQSYLLDILVSVPGLLEDHLLLTRSDQGTSPNSQLILHSDLVSKITACLTKLYRWRWKWQIQFGAQVSTECNPDQPIPTLASQATQCGYPITQPRLKFARPGAAADIMLYNAVLVWLLALLWDLEPVNTNRVIRECTTTAHDTILQAETDNLPNITLGTTNAKIGLQSERISFAPLLPPDDSVSVRDVALEICQALEWQRRNHDVSNEANFMYILPVGMALSVLDADPEHHSWILSVLEANEFTRGYAGGLVHKSPSNAGEGPVESSSAIGGAISSMKSSPRNNKDCTKRVNQTHTKGFGLYITREKLGSETISVQPNDPCYAGQEEEAVKQLTNPGLLHLLEAHGVMMAS